MTAVALLPKYLYDGQALAKANPRLISLILQTTILGANIGSCEPDIIKK
jgi:hypothetical protein